MAEKKENPTVFTYLDRIMGSDGIKTSNKIEFSMDRESALTLLGIGIGLVVFSHLLGAGIQALSKNKKSA